jgi:hypothetical protein
MKPRFGIITRLIATTFAVAGIGAAVATYEVSGAGNKIVLLVLAVGFLVLAVGLWSESISAWWVGAVVVGLTVLLARVLGAPGGAGPIWIATFVGFAVSGFQGWRDGVNASAPAAE